MEMQKIVLDRIVAIEFCPSCYNHTVYSDMGLVFHATSQKEIQAGYMLKPTAEDEGELSLGQLSTCCSISDDLYFGFSAEDFLRMHPEAKFIDHNIWAGFKDSKDEETPPFLCKQYKYSLANPVRIHVPEIDLRAASTLIYDENVDAACLNSIQQNIKGIKCVPGYEKIRQILQLYHDNITKTCRCRK